MEASASPISISVSISLLILHDFDLNTKQGAPVNP